MDFDKKEIPSYLDGVPFTIGQKFCPPKSIPLPFAVTYQLPDELLENKYDFSLESKVLAYCKAKDEAEENLKEEMARKSTENSGSDDNSSGEGNQSTNVSSTTLWNSDFILQPKSQVPNNNSEATDKNATEDLKYINLSDFEIDTNSPFDNIELQTINDFKELSTVFEGLSKDVSADKLRDNENSSDGVTSSGNAEQSSGNVSKSMSFPLVQDFNSSYSKSDMSMDTLSNSSSFVSPSTLPVLKSFAKNCDGYLSYSTPSMSAMCDEGVDLSHEKSKRNSSYSDSYPVSSPYSLVNQVPCVVTSVGQTTNLCQNVDNPSTSSNYPLRSSKSISDLSDMLPPASKEAHSYTSRSHTPPAKAYNVAHYEFENVVSSTKKSDDSFSYDFSKNGVCSPKPEERDFLDPYDELSNAEKGIIDYIIDMGFDRGQVSRTVKHLGTDEKKVVEHLCQIQVLEESGYDKLEAEAALHLHDYNKNEAIKYLDLISQFQDLGFEKEAIKKALVQNKNDRDKVIDALLS